MIFPIIDDHATYFLPVLVGMVAFYTKIWLETPLKRKLKPNNKEKNYVIYGTAADHSEIQFLSWKPTLLSNIRFRVP